MKPYIVCIVSFVLTAALHSLAMGAILGLVLTVVLLIHELGHAIALRIEKLPATPPVSIPFVTGFVVTKGAMNRETGAFVAIMGPFLGTLAAVVAATPFFITHDTAWLRAAELGVLFNAINLAPLRPFDGGIIIGSRKGLNKVSGIALLPFLTLTFVSGGKLAAFLVCYVGFVFWVFNKLKERTPDEMREQCFLELIQERISYSYVACWAAVFAADLALIHCFQYVRENY